MAILAFQKPDKVLMLEANNFFGKFEFRPLEPGYGITIGNALRRILLSSLEGYAFSSVKIEGVDHEFATIPGVMEDVTNIILNLKQVRFKCIAEEMEELPKVVLNVKYTGENLRVEQKTDYEKLLLEITTDGSIHPKEALKEAAKILIQHFMLFSDDKIAVETMDVDGNEEFDEDILHMRQLLKTRLIDMNLSVRALNCLKAADVDTVGELVQFNKNDLLKFRNFGKKSLTELDELLENLNLSFGMDISKYKLDKE